MYQKYLKRKSWSKQVWKLQSIHNSRAPNINAVNIRQKVLDIPTNLSARTTVTENINEHFVQQYPICVQITNKIERHAPNKTFFVRFPWCPSFKWKQLCLLSKDTITINLSNQHVPHSKMYNKFYSWLLADICAATCTFCN